MKIRNTMKDFAIITLGTAIAAAAVYFFMLPSHVSVGSGAALAMVLSNYIPLSVSIITLIMNVLLLVIGFILLGPEFGVKTVYCAILLPVIMGLFEWLFPDFQSITQDPLLDVICYILLVGMEDGLFRVNDPNSVANSQKKWSYEDICSMEFRTVIGADCYKYDEKTDIYYFNNDMIVNLFPLLEIVPRLERIKDKEFIEVMIHEQYFYEYFHMYQPDFADKVEACVKYLSESGRQSVFLNELIKRKN
mgnify:CR=1 FL=1